MAFRRRYASDAIATAHGPMADPGCTMQVRFTRLLSGRTLSLRRRWAEQDGVIVMAGGDGATNRRASSGGGPGLAAGQGGRLGPG